MAKQHNTRPHLYILDGHTPVGVYDVLEWANFFEFGDERRIVKQDTIEGGAWVSTVFLGLDHGMAWRPGSKPLLFETMVFRGEEILHEYTQRYATWVGAEHGHAKTVELYLKKLKEGTEAPRI